MLAIPVDTEQLETRSSLLFGNVSFFALYNEKDNTFDVRKNPGCGNGIKTAEALKSWNVKKVVYSFLGDGPFKSMINNGIDIFHVGKKSVSIEEIISGVKENRFMQVNTSNAEAYLDPGTTSGSCQCGCSHD